ncbi:MAG: helix-turn-helix domain-containing protein [Caldilineaceae bacterium]
MNPTFGSFLKQLRKRAGMSQHDLAAATGYSRALISALEQNRRLPDVHAVRQNYLPALGLQDEPRLAKQLLELAALARGERPITYPLSSHLLHGADATADTEGRVRLPSSPTMLIGREQETNHLCQRVLSHQGRLLTLVGPPGIGKTRLALVVAEQLHLHYRDGACFVPLATIADTATLVSAILTAVGGRNTGPQPPQNQLIEHLRRKSLLLVLDNFEQLLAPTLTDEAVQLVATLTAECPGLMVLTTSRERLHLRSEQCYKVPPLSLAAALDLFTQRAQAVHSAFGLAAHNRPIVEAICVQLDRLPLAIELCAAQIELLSPAQLLAQLKARPLDLLMDGARDLQPQQRTLRGAIQHSYALLSEAERTLFRALGIFVDGFALPELAAVIVGDSATEAERFNNPVILQSLLPLLRSLIGKSLVHSQTDSTGEQRFFLLEILREFALEKLQIQGEELALRRRHFAVYLQLFRIGDSHLRQATGAIWVSRLTAEQGNLRAALQWAFDTAHYVDATWLLVGVHYFWHFHGHWHEGARWTERLLPYRHLLATDLRLALWINYCAYTYELAAFQSLDCYPNEIMSLLENCDNQLLQSAALHWRALMMADSGQAVTLLMHCAALARAMPKPTTTDIPFSLLGDRDFLLAAYHWGVALRLIGQGEFSLAEHLLDGSLTLYQERGDRFGIADCYSSLGRLALLQGDLVQAQAHFHEAVTIATAASSPEKLRQWQPLLAIATLYAGDTAAARRLLGESLQRCMDLQDDLLLAEIYLHLAECALWEEEHIEARQWLVQSLHSGVDPRWMTIHRISQFWVAARLATAQQQYHHSAIFFGLADQMHSQIHYMIGGPMRALADDALATVQTALEPAAFAKAIAAGRQMTLEDAFEMILTASPKAAN